MRKQKNKPRPPSSKKERYKVINWAEYNRSLIKRGRLDVWISPKILDKWYYSGPKEKGGQFQYSNECIEACLSIKVLYKLGYRQTQGFLESLFSLSGYDLKIPSYSDLCKRCSNVVVKEKSMRRFVGGTGITVVADSTGLKVFGEGEWKVRRHGWSKHRTWQKLHLAVEPNEKIIVANELTTNSVDDAAMVVPLLNQASKNITTFTADGAYDKKKVYETLSEKKIKSIIPPRKGARIKKHGNKKGLKNNRDQNIRMIRKTGRKRWKEKINYHKRSIAETTMFRYKTIISDKLCSRTFERQKIETKIGCKILNMMTLAGMPVSIKIRAA